jgi:hypothetical protein
LIIIVYLFEWLRIQTEIKAECKFFRKTVNFTLKNIWSYELHSSCQLLNFNDLVGCIILMTFMSTAQFWWHSCMLYALFCFDFKCFWLEHHLTLKRHYLSKHISSVSKLVMCWCQVSKFIVSWILKVFIIHNDSCMFRFSGLTIDTTDQKFNIEEHLEQRLTGKILQ